MSSIDHRTPELPERPAPKSALVRLARDLMRAVEHTFGVDCRTFTRLDSDRHERPLGAGERLRYSVHGAICAICRLQRSRQSELRALAREPLDDPKVELSSDAKERMRRAMDEALRRGPR